MTGSGLSAVYGSNVAVRGDTLVVSGTGSDATKSGRVVVFCRSGTVWTQQAVLTSSSQPDRTFGGAIAFDGETIVVASYDAHTAALPLSVFSSAGPTRDGREKPELCAPGHAVVAARSRSRTGTTQKSGTSMAAPAVAGAVALMLSEARARNKSLTSSNIRDILRKSARQHPQQGGALWNPRTGIGRVGVRAALEAIAALPAPGASLPRTEVTVVGGKGRIKTPQKPQAGRQKRRTPGGRPTVGARRHRATR